MTEESDLTEEIERAFSGVEQPLEITLYVAEAHDDYDFNDEENRKRDYIGEWQDIPSKHIEDCQMALNYVDKIGMRFYLPAYMVWYISKVELGEIEGDTTLYVLNNYSNNSDMYARFIERFSLFDEKQLGVCAKFVKYCMDRGGPTIDSEFAEEIYESYWKRFI